MTFTDDDLKRLKEESSNGDSSHTGPEELKALIARLEAAERVVNFVVEEYTHHEGEHIFRSGLEAWRKSKGE